MATALVHASPSKVHSGRPTLYRPEYCEQIIDFFRSHPLTKPIDDGGDSLKRSVQAVCGTVPTFQRFADSIDVDITTLTEWRRRHLAFSIAYARAKTIQEDFFTQGLSQGIMNPTGAIFVAKNILGWKDKTEVETVNSQDSQDMGQMKQALANATAAQLAQFSALIAAMQAQVPAVLPAAEE